MALNPPSSDIATFLAAQGAGTIGTDIFVGMEPSEPDATITVYDTGGIAPNPKFLRDEPQVQVRIRGAVNDYQNAWIKAQETKDILLGAQPQILNGTDYVLFVQIGEMIALGRDENNRPLIVSNWQLVREMASGGNREAF